MVQDKNGVYQNFVKVGLLETYILKNGVIPSEYTSKWSQRADGGSHNSNYGELKIYKTSGSAQDQSTVYACSIDLTNVSTIIFRGRADYASNNKIGAFSTLNYSDSVTYKWLGDTTDSIEVDVSGLSGTYLIGATAYTSNGGYIYNCYLTDIILK